VRSPRSDAHTRRALPLPVLIPTGRGWGEGLERDCRLHPPEFTRTSTRLDCFAAPRNDECTAPDVLKERAPGTGALHCVRDTTHASSTGARLYPSDNPACGRTGRTSSPSRAKASQSAQPPRRIFYPTGHVQTPLMNTPPVNARQGKRASRNIRGWHAVQSNLSSAPV
jgi:hypothetical protein